MPTGIYKRKKSSFERFQEKYEIIGSGCWFWTGCKDSSGYGQFSFNGVAMGAHRWSFEYYKHKIPENMVIDHLCRNPSCINPDHLDCVTMKENTERGILYEVFAQNAKNKTHCKRGHPLFGDNLKRDSRGDRQCRVCQADKGREWKKANRERVNHLQRERRKNGRT